jgi:hypothetical protein
VYSVARASAAKSEYHDTDNQADPETAFRFHVLHDPKAELTVDMAKSAM